MEDLSVSYLNDKFNMYYQAAKRAYAERRGALAKKNYLLAAEALMQLAKQSTPKLKQARMQRAKRLVEIAESIDTAMENNQIPKGQAEEKPQSQSQGDGAREWTAATIPDIHFDDIAGLEDVKKAITTRMINPIKYPEKYQMYNKKSGGGVLLYGPPGTGKTMIAKAIACEVGAKFYAVKGSDVVSKWVGESEKNINSLFQTARADDRAIIFLDEIDSLMGKRGVDTHNDKRVNEFLQQIDGFAGRATNLLLLGATNRPWDVDSAALRSGRFSQKIYVPLPDAPARKFMFEKSLKGTPVQDIQIDKLVELSEGYSGADIEEVCDRAKEDPLLESIKTDKPVPVTMQNFVTAFAAVPPSVSKKEVERFERYMRG